MSHPEVTCAASGPLASSVSKCHGSASLSSRREASSAKLLVGTMDGSISILDAEEGHVLCTIKAHTKYCVQASWNPLGTGFVTASWDQSLCIYEWPASKGGESSLTPLPSCKT